MAEPLAAAPAPAVASARSVPQGAAFAVAVLTAMNLLNYVDRYVPSAVKELFKTDLGLSDAQTSLPLTSFVVVYMLTSPVFGELSNRFSRKWLIATGVALWSAATAAAAFAHGFWTFLSARALVGVGEAAYATITPSIISDFYPPARRNRILTLFYAAIPVGAAIGFTVGGVLGAHFGWRAAFLACGLPGLLTSLLVLATKEPPRGRFDAEQGAPVPRWSEALATLARNREYVLVILGYTAVTFASGALADWFPTFLVRERGFDVASAGSITGTTAAVGGLLGTVLGGVLGDWLRGKTRHPYLALSGFSMLGGTLSVILALVLRDHTAIWACMFLGQVMVWCYNGPINALIVNSVSSGLRTRAVSLSIFSIHCFGDAVSPSVVGFVSDRTHDLRFAITLVPVALVVGTAIWLGAWRLLPERQPQGST